MAWAFCSKGNDKGFTNCYFLQFLEAQKNFDIQNIYGIEMRFFFR